jgi:hypothetical protein
MRKIFALLFFTVVAFSARQICAQMPEFNFRARPEDGIKTDVEFAKRRKELRYEHVQTDNFDVILRAVCRIRFGADNGV